MAREIHIRYHYEPDGTWWADSPDLERFTAAAGSFDEVRRQAREGAGFFAGEPAMVVEEGIPEGARPQLPNAGDVQRVVVVVQGILSHATHAGGFPTVVTRVDPVGERGVWRQGALEDPELVA